MGDLFAVNKVRIYGGSGFAFPVDYRVQVSLDGTTWTDVAVRNGDPGMEGWREIGFDAQTARFVRVYGDKLVDKGRDGYLMQIGEVEAYGTPAVDSDAANAALEALEAARAKITGEDTTALGRGDQGAEGRDRRREQHAERNQRPYQGRGRGACKVHRQHGRRPLRLWPRQRML